MVYIHYIASNPSSPAPQPLSTWVAISPNRNTADTLFRILQDNQGRTLKVPTARKGEATLTPQGIERLSPKLWVLHTKESLDNMACLSAPAFHEVDAVFSPVAGKLFLYRMEDSQSLASVPLPQICDIDHDYISGGSFFIRRCGYPNTFWYCCGNLICLSTTKRSRFVITIADENANKDKTPMIDRDQVTIQWIDQDASKLVGVDTNEWLTVKAKDSKIFRFSDFQGRFHLGNEGTEHNPGPASLTTNLDVVCWSSPHVFHDSFELCYGIAPCDE
ncbi:hypothetical protein BDW59DRAFT_16410 [Aspergillus cavernicola]|uniref:Uncharacterized protein n=1 Tax=Aspergillus cavernicola TaxID=176166 RepID=A0ABR4HIT8_9EURO